MILAEYVDHMGSDLTVVNSARVSFNKESKPQANGLVSIPDEKLIRYLAKHNHFTPFTHPVITLRETVPIFVARQRFKHVIGFTYNEVSRRYVDDTPEFYVPDEWRSRPEGSLKQGSGTSTVPELVADDFPGGGYSMPTTEVYQTYLSLGAKLYQRMLDAGIAPEQARMVLPQSMLTSYYVTGSLAAWARAFKLRIDPHAQLEIQTLAQQWETIIEPLFPVSWDALTRN